MRYKVIWFFSILLALMFAACELINPAEDIPATIRVDSVSLIIEQGQGTARYKITEVWTYANSNLLGAFFPPVEIRHITSEESSDFSFWPGIRNNGRLDDAIIYPMFSRFEMELNTSPGAYSEVIPVFRYKPEAVFSLISDFETQNDFIDNRDSIPESMLVRSSEEPFEGNYSGMIIMDTTAFFLEVGHVFAITDLPVDGTTPAYLEFHYKTEVELAIGLLGIPLDGQSFSNFFYVVKPNENWNKIYLELTPHLALSAFPAYKILFRSHYPPGATKPSYKIQLDNIQVVHL